MLAFLTVCWGPVFPSPEPDPADPKLSLPGALPGFCLVLWSLLGPPWAPTLNHEA